MLFAWTRPTRRNPKLSYGILFFPYQEQRCKAKKTFERCLVYLVTWSQSCVGSSSQTGRCSSLGLGVGTVPVAWGDGRGGLGKDDIAGADAASGGVFAVQNHIAESVGDPLPEFGRCDLRHAVGFAPGGICIVDL